MPRLQIPLLMAICLTGCPRNPIKEALEPLADLFRPHDVDAAMSIVRFDALDTFRAFANLPEAFEDPSVAQQLGYEIDGETWRVVLPRYVGDADPIEMEGTAVQLGPDGVDDPFVN